MKGHHYSQGECVPGCKECRFHKVTQRYYNWKAMQPKGTPLDTEQAALRWGYEAAERDVAGHIMEVLGLKP